MSALKTKFGPGWLATTLLGIANGVASLGSDGKLSPAQIPAALTGGLTFKGNFDASTGSYPTSPSTGDYYNVSVAGTVSGQVLTVGDQIFYSSVDSAWHVIDTSKSTSDLPEGTNLYFTAGRAQTAAVINSLAASTTQAPTTSAVNTALATKANNFTRTKERYVLSATNITNGYIILNQLATALSMHAGVQGLGLIEESLDAGTTGDYLLSTDGGTNHTKLTWKNDLASGGATALAAGDVIYVGYSY